jgi:protein-tyrosine phosphatase
MRVLFVCLGNICRSPLAEAIFVHKTTQQGMAGLFKADSCGTSNYNIGEGPDHRTQANAHRNGVQVNHTARQITPDDVMQFDRILVMDDQNYKNVLSFCDPEHHHKVMMIRAFDPYGPGDVPDPYWGHEQDFQDVFEMLDRTIDELIRHLAKEKPV